MLWRLSINSAALSSKKSVLLRHMEQLALSLEGQRELFHVTEEHRFFPADGRLHGTLCRPLNA